MTEPVYVPILKGKEGEYAALEVLCPNVRALLMPLIEVPEIPYDYAAEAPAKTLDQHLGSIPERLKKACGEMPFYLDVTWLEEKKRLANGSDAFAFLLVKLAALNCKVIPVLYRKSPAASLDSVKAYCKDSNDRFCVRLLTSDFNDDELDEEVERLLSTCSTGEQPDLLIDLGDIGTNAGTASLVARSIFSMIPQRDRWHKIILAGASFPEDLSEVSASTIVNLPRHEWDLWKLLQRRPAALPRRDLMFGDYAMAHPVGKSLDPRTMKMSANIRYTAESDWLIVKGRNVRKYGFDQYFDLCEQLVQRPEYAGRDFSWGDRYISDCTDGMQGPGNATTWRKVGVNHHITLVANQIANLARAV